MNNYSEAVIDQDSLIDKTFSHLAEIKEKLTEM